MYDVTSSPEYQTGRIDCGSRRKLYYLYNFAFQVNFYYTRPRMKIVLRKFDHI